MHEVTLKPAQLESIRKKVCTKCAQKRISHHLKCAKRQKKSPKSMQKVCKTSKIVCIYSVKCTLCRLMHTLKKCARIYPPMGTAASSRSVGAFPVTAMVTEQPRGLSPPTPHPDPHHRRTRAERPCRRALTQALLNPHTPHPCSTTHPAIQAAPHWLSALSQTSSVGPDA